VGTLIQDTFACRDLANQSGTFDKAVYESCLIRKGFQKTGENTYSRTTGVNPAVAVAALSAAIPVLGSVIPTVTNVATQIGARAPTTGPDVAAIATPINPSAASSQAAPAGGSSPPMDSKTLLFLGIGAIVLFFAMRR